MFVTREQVVGNALKTAKRGFPHSPPAPRVVDLKYELGFDATGDEAVRVWVILDDATPKALLRHASFKPIENRVRTAIQNALLQGTQFRLDLTPYVYFRLKSEQDEIEAAGGA